LSLTRRETQRNCNSAICTRYIKELRGTGNKFGIKTIFKSRHTIKDQAIKRTTRIKEHAGDVGNDIWEGQADSYKQDYMNTREILQIENFKNPK
jgi:hypothetical protein